MSNDNLGLYNGYNSYKSYIDSIKDIPRISKEEEIELSKVIMGDDKEKADKAINKLTVANLLLVVKYATEYHRKLGNSEYGISLMDLIEEGNLGVIRAATTYDSEKGGFSTYATYYIKRFMQRARGNFRFIRVPLNHYQVSSKVRQLKNDGVEITNDVIENVSKECGCSPKQVRFAITCDQLSVVGFDSIKSADDDGFSNLLDFYVSDEKPLDTDMEKNDAKKYLFNKIATLSQVEQDAISIRYFGDAPVTCEEMAKQWGISKQRVSQILSGALKKLKFRIELDQINEDIENS